MKIDQEMQEKIQDLQMFEQNMQNILLQKQAFQMELNETENALSEISKSKDDIFKIVGNIMLKASREDTEKELKEKKDIISLRLKSIDKQSSSLQEKSEKLREEVMKGIKSSNPEEK